MENVPFHEFSINGLNLVGNLYENSGNIKPWVKTKKNYLLESKKNKWIQLINGSGTSWKKLVKEEKANLITLSISNHEITI